MIIKIFACFTIFLSLFVGCRERKSTVAGSKLQSEDGGWPADCGLTVEELKNPKSQLYSGTFTSQDIVVTGRESRVDYRVTTVADVQLDVTAEEAVQNVMIRVKEAVVTNGALARAAGESTVKMKAAQTAREKSTVTKHWFYTFDEQKDFVEKNAEFKGIRCSSLLTYGIVTSAAGYQFSPAVITVMNPKASIERMEFELGKNKVFNVEAQVYKQDKKTKGTQTIRPTTPQLEVNGEMIKVDAAWEILNDFPGGSGQFNLPKRQVFYMRRDKKDFVAILIEYDSGDPGTIILSNNKK